MSIIVPSSQHLGDSLSAQEKLLQKFEETDRMLQRYRLDDHEELKKAEERMGQRMDHPELIRRITKLNHGIWAEDSISDRTVVGLYRVNPKDGTKQYLVAFDKGSLPEFSIIFTDNADLPIKEKRGWRTVLSRLIAQGALSWSQVMTLFEDAHGKHSRRWKMNTQRFRS